MPPSEEPPKNEMSATPSKADQLYLAVLNGLPLWRIEYQANTLATNAKERDEIIQAVRRRLETSAFIDPIVVKGFCVSSLQEIYAKMMKDKNFDGAIKALREYNRVANTEINDNLTEADDGEPAEKK